MAAGCGGGAACCCLVCPICPGSCLRGVVFLLLAGCGVGCIGWAGSATAMARGGGVELGEPERYCARLVKLDRFRCDDDFEFPAISAELVVMGMGGTGTLMHDMGEMILGGKAAATVAVGGGGGGGGSGGGGGGMGEADVKTRLGGAVG